MSFIDKNYILRLFLIFGFFCTSLTKNVAQNGEKVFEFLRFPTSTRTTALGGNNISIVEPDISMVYQNPALLGPEMDMHLNASYLLYLADIGLGTASFGKMIDKRSAWGVGVNFMNYGTMDETSSENVTSGTFSSKDIAINAFYSHDLSEKWRGGVTTKFIYSSFAEYSATAFGVDVGLSYFDPEKLFSFSLVGSNIGTQLSTYHEERIAMPWDISAGFSKQLSHAPIRFSVTAVHLKTWKFNKPDVTTNTIIEEEGFGKTFFKHLVLGVDFVPNDNFWVGMGYNIKRAQDMKLIQGNRLGGWSAGAGLNVKKFGFGFAVSNYHPKALTYQFSVNANLSKWR